MSIRRHLRFYSLGKATYYCGRYKMLQCLRLINNDAFCMKKSRPHISQFLFGCSIAEYCCNKITFYVPMTNLYFSGVAAKDVTKDDLTIPDSYCNPKNKHTQDGVINGHKCPPGFDCIKLSDLGQQKTGFIGFGHFFTSVFSVYTG